MPAKKNKQPEFGLQCRIARMLMTRLPPEIEWTASAAGVRVSPRTANKMKAAGIRPDWMDLQFMCEDGITRYIEVKIPDGKLSTGQKRIAAVFTSRRPDIYAVCRTVDEVVLALTTWGIVLKPEVPDVGAYDDGLSFAEAFE